jgi:hypothetical protein
VLGGIAAWRFFRRRSESAAEPAPAAPAPEADPRADALRAKLDEVRETGPEADTEPSPEPVPEPEPEPAGEQEPPLAEPEPDSEPDSADPEERRRTVHEHGRAALEEMRGGDGDEAAS